MKKLNVLVIDDEPGIRSGIVRILRNYSVGFPFMEEDFGFDLIEAGTGEEALEFIKNNHADIVLLDNKLPGIEGVEVLEYISKNNYDAIVMMITSYASLDLAVKATKNGAYNFVPKPFTPAELKAAMESITKHLFLKRITSKMNDEEKKVKFQFLSVLSHELKSPINAVEGYLRMLQEKQVGANLDDYMEMIDRSLVRMKGMRHLISDLLDLTKIESGEKNRDISLCDIYEIAKFSIDTFTPLAAHKNISVLLDSPEAVMYKSDKHEMEIILNNLISNAIKYNKDNGRVNIVIKDLGTEVKIVVEDTGIGMSSDDIAKLFHDFVRIKNSNTRNIAGTGLGLSIVKKLAEMYGGNVYVTSTPGEGSAFEVNLPR